MFIGRVLICEARNFRMRLAIQDGHIEPKVVSQIFYFVIFGKSTFKKLKTIEKDLLIFQNG